MRGYAHYEKSELRKLARRLHRDQGRDYRYWLKKSLICRSTGHLWSLTSYSSSTHLATLRCARCNPDGVGHPKGEKITTYSGV